MDERRDRLEDDFGATRSVGGPAAGALGSLRGEMLDLLAAADRSIARSLSRDSERYLRAVRQQGGQ